MLFEATFWFQIGILANTHFRLKSEMATNTTISKMLYIVTIFSCLDDLITVLALKETALIN